MAQKPEQEEREIGREEAFSRSIVDQAGMHKTPPGHQLSGYAVVFFYAHKLGPSMEIHCMSETRRLTEGTVNTGWKMLGKHLRSKFGRKTG